MRTSVALLSLVALPALASRPHQKVARTFGKDSPAPAPSSSSPSTCTSLPNLAPGSLTAEDGCSWYHEAVKGETAESILAIYPNKLSLKAFLAINPSVKDGVKAGKSYCVAGPIEPAPGTKTIEDGCVKYRIVKRGDTCIGIVDAIGDISLEQLYSFNTYLHQPSCDNLPAGLQICTCDGKPTPIDNKPSGPPSNEKPPQQGQPPVAGPPSGPAKPPVNSPPSAGTPSPAPGSQQPSPPGVKPPVAGPSPSPGSPAPAPPAAQPPTQTCPNNHGVFVPKSGDCLATVQLCLSADVLDLIHLDLGLYVGILCDGFDKKFGDVFCCSDLPALPTLPGGPTLPPVVVQPPTTKPEPCEGGVLIPEGSDCLLSLQLCAHVGVLDIIDLNAALSLAICKDFKPEAGKCFQCPFVPGLPVKPVPLPLPLPPSAGTPPPSTQPGNGAPGACPNGKGILVPKDGDCLATVKLCLDVNVLNIIDLDVGLYAGVLCKDFDKKKGDVFCCDALPALPQQPGGGNGDHSVHPKPEFPQYPGACRPEDGGDAYAPVKDGDTCQGLVNFHVGLGLTLLDFLDLNAFIDIDDCNKNLKPGHSACLRGPKKHHRRSINAQRRALAL